MGAFALLNHITGSTQPFPGLLIQRIPASEDKHSRAFLPLSRFAFYQFSVSSTPTLSLDRKVPLQQWFHRCKVPNVPGAPSFLVQSMPHTHPVHSALPLWLMQRLMCSHCETVVGNLLREIRDFWLWDG